MQQSSINASNGSSLNIPSTRFRTDILSNNPLNPINEVETDIITRKKLDELLEQVSPHYKLDPDVAEILIDMADDFVEGIVSSACQLAKHRKSNTLEVKDLQFHLEHIWNIKIPGFSSDFELNNEASHAESLKPPTVGVHQQRLELIKKAQAQQESQQQKTT